MAKGQLALDISGSCTGWSFAKDNKLISFGKHISDTKTNRGERLYEFGKWLETLLEELNPEIVLIERPFLGRNSKVLVNLSKFVAVAEYTAFKVLSLNIEPEWLIDPRSIKRALKIPKPKKNNRHEHKRLMVKRINSLYGLRLKYGKNKSKKHNDDDIADAIGLWTCWNLKSINK